MLPLNACPALVLNADYQPLSYFPLSLWNWQEAIKAIFLDRVAVVSHYERSIRSPGFELRLPSVVALKQYIPQDRRCDGLVLPMSLSTVLAWLSTSRVNSSCA